MEGELLASRAKIDAIQLVLQAIMLKLEIDVENPKEEPGENSMSAEGSESMNFDEG